MLFDDFLTVHHTETDTVLRNIALVTLSAHLRIVGRLQWHKSQHMYSQRPNSRHCS